LNFNQNCSLIFLYFWNPSWPSFSMLPTFIFILEEMKVNLGNNWLRHNTWQNMNVLRTRYPVVFIAQDNWWETCWRRQQQSIGSSRVDITVLAGKGFPSCSRSARGGSFQAETRGDERGSALRGKGEEKSRFKRLYMWHRQPWSQQLNLTELVPLLWCSL